MADSKWQSLALTSSYLNSRKHAFNYTVLYTLLVCSNNLQISVFYNKDGLFLLTFLHVAYVSDVILLHTSYSGTQAEGAAPILAPEEKKQF